MTARRRHRYPLHVTLSAAFTALLAVVGAALIAFNYLENRKMALVGADDLLDRVDEHLRLAVTGLYTPAQNAVDLAARTLPATSEVPEQGARSLGFVSEVLRLEPGIAAIFAGYADGDFFLLRRLTAWPDLDQTVEVPADADFVLQRIVRGAAPPAEEDLMFYDSNLDLTGKTKRPWQGFDPRQRDWYTRAMASTEQIATGFYRAFSTGEISVTFARRIDGGGGVVGADLTLEGLSAGLARQRVTPSARVAMLTAGGGVVALPDDRLLADLAGTDEEIRMPQVSDLDDPVYRQVAEHLDAAGGVRHRQITVDGRPWLLSLSELPTQAGKALVLATVLPRDELLADVIEIRNRGVLVSVALLLVALPAGAAVARYISKSLAELAQGAQKIRELRLDAALDVRSNILEVDDLAVTMGMMKDALKNFIDISRALSAEKDFDRLLAAILEETRRISGAEGGAILLAADDESGLEVAILERPGAGADGDSGAPAVSLAGTAIHAFRTGEAVRVDDAASAARWDLGGTRERYESPGHRVRSVLCVPLKNSQDESIGVLQLVNARDAGGDVIAFRDRTVPYVEALASSAAVALDNRRLLQAQRDLLDSFILVVAGAIDAKSPYTGGHCQRVPIVASMLAEAADDSSSPTFADFRLSDDERYALHLASWLHDCGKVTTPEYVVDKATKLETLYDRIHEIRMRFEVLWRDSEIDYYRGRLAADADDATLERRRQERQAQVRDDFEFIARCNNGDNFLSDEMIERLEQVGAQTWTRHLDDRAGVSHGELTRMGAEPAELPATERVLADKPEHVIPRIGDHPFGDNRYGFRMEVPDSLYNLGELYNLRVRSGTLSDEERFKINEHVVQSIQMLDRLPFPRELRQVPDWAGNHHEKLDGTGYPRRLPAESLSIPERVMAVADVFEALTASDRPYMHPKTLSRALAIMRSMCDEGHLCPDLFALLLRSGVYRRYAGEHLRPEQLDEVDVEALVPDSP